MISTKFPPGSMVRHILDDRVYEVVEAPPEWPEDGYVWVPVNDDPRFPVHGYIEDRFELVSLPGAMPDPDFTLDEIHQAQDAYERTRT